MRATLLALAGAAALTAAAVPGTAQAAPAEQTRTTQVTYQGRTFTVPASWSVVDLAKAPDTCVRFDRHAVYLGTPSAQQDCPAKELGRTEAVLIQPERGRSSAAGQVTENRTAKTYRADADGLTVTAAYGSDKKTVQNVLRSADLPVDDATEAPAAGAAPAVKAVPTDATSFQGKGFDKCDAPSTAQLNAWHDASPYSAVGVYIGGVNAGCPPSFDAAWVQTQYDNGWRFFPIYVGPQAERGAGSCTGDCEVITDPVPQGAASARDAAAQAESLGFAKGSVLYFNMEQYTRGGAVSDRVLAFIQSWTTTLHELGYVSGVYGSVSSLITDLVAQDGTGYVQPDVIDFARWVAPGGEAGEPPADTGDPQIPDHMWADHQRIRQYSGDVTETYGGVTMAIDADLLDVGQGVVQPPQQKDTALTYTGPTSLSDGSPAELSATLTEKDGGAPVADREVAFALGGDTAQTCTAKTDAQGAARCTVASVDQPLTADATVPLTASFAGDDAYKASQAEALLKLQYVTGRAYGLNAKVSALGLPVSIGPAPDTGTVRTAGATKKIPPCTASVNAVVLSASALCADVTTTTGPSGASAGATVDKVRIGLTGLPVVELSGVRSEVHSTCSATTGGTGLTLRVGGFPVDVGDEPNAVVDLGAGARLVVNEQTRSGDGLTVDAVHLTALAGAVDIVVASSTAAAHNCG
ncbi:choice-of-anchor P family protein [Streptomyces sp. VRA16 Mangrove soil]|uniref:choice-of-anchor P family protein n=1 Tax=Streptomyces sp. VRA16 Mangrove soil TaxID=2817434 RepID=UPI001E4647EC|nr:choice-of-anchor P family protein [Streptomyces sp. VRA16 Mangrove soil]